MMLCRSRAKRCRPGTERTSEQAIALPLAMFVTVIVLFIGLAFMELSRMEAERARCDAKSLEALAAAELGLERAKAMCASQNAPWTIMTYGGDYLDFRLSSDPLYEGSYICDLFINEPAREGGDVTYSVIVEDLSTWFPGSGSYRIHAFGHSGEIVRHITEDARTLTYAAFGWLTDREDGIYFATGDKVDGWVYTNDRLNIWGTPVFTGKVNSAASYIHYGHGGPPIDDPDFQQGVTLNSPVIDMDNLINNGHIAAVRNRAQDENGIWLGPNRGRPYLVDFHADGTVTIQRQKRNGSWVTVIDNKDLSTTNGAIYIEEQTGVRGTVNGQVTLATPETKDIYVLDDLIYAHPLNKEDPFKEDFDFADNNLDDKLGLIAGRDIVVYKSWSESWSDMYIMASLLAVTGSFRNYYYQSYGFRKLHILGGVAQDTRGPVGMVNNRGFLKDYRYDQRFMSEPPPHFPMAMYDFNTWQLAP